MAASPIKQIQELAQNSPGRSFDEKSQTDDSVSVDLQKDIHEIKAWDEGGPSDCGYSTGVHDMLMAIGGTVHKVAGDPSAPAKKALATVGNWFQEASYAVRDIFRGKTEDMQENANVVVNNTLNELMYSASQGGGGDEKKLDPPSAN
jgi:hypothetical protein